MFLLQPRRVAARSIARRIAEEQGWTLGEEVGFQVRFEKRFSKDTRLLVATEGVLTRRLQSDPLLEAFRTIVLDEFHERSLHADLALAFARQAWRARSDLRLLVMSATLDAGPVARFLDDCPVIEVAGRPHPIEVRYEPRTPLADAVRAVLARPGGHVLCFLPGAPEIRRAQGELGGVAGARVLPLHGTLSGDEQDAALAACAERKVILATNVAETSLTVEGVTDVIDTRAAQGDALRPVARARPARARADPRGLGGAARRARRAHGAGPRASAVGRARPPAPEARAGDRARGPRLSRPRRAGVGRRPAVVRVVRGAAGRALSRPRSRCSNGSTPARTAA